MYHYFIIFISPTKHCRFFDFIFFDVIQLCQHIPRQVLELVYGINIAPPGEGEDPKRAPYAEELLSAYGCKCVSVKFEYGWQICFLS